MTLLPKLAHSLDAWPLFESPGSKSCWAVGSNSIDRYLTVPAESADAVQLALQLMDGSRTVEEISMTLQSRIGRSMDVARLARLAGSAGLLTTLPDGVRASRSQFDRLSLTLFTLPLGRAFGWIEANAKSLPAIWLSAQAAIAFLAVAMMIVLPPASAGGAVPVAAVTVACLLSLLAHEASHCFVALDKGVKPTSLSVAIYAGVMPVMYVRLPGIFRLAPGDRLRVWIAGCLCNGVIALASNAIARLPGLSAQSGAFWSYVERWNVALIIVSLVPFLPTDGYFILSTILRTHNLRSRAYSAAGAMLNGRLTGFDWKAFLFLLAAVLAIVAGIVSSASQWTSWAQRHGVPPAWGWGMPFFFLFCAWILRTAGERINNWRWGTMTSKKMAGESSAVFPNFQE